MFELLEAEDRNPYLYYGDRRHAMRLPKPNVDLNRLLRVASTSVAMSEAANRLEGEGSLGRRENSLLQAYFDLRANVYGKEPRLAATIRCLALNQSARTLYRDDLDNVIDKHVRTKGDCVDLVNTISAHWAGALRYSPDGSMCLKGWLTRDNFYLDDELGVSIGGQQVGPTEVLNDVCSTALNDTHQLARALKDIAQ